MTDLEITDYLVLVPARPGQRKPTFTAYITENGKTTEFPFTDRVYSQEAVNKLGVEAAWKGNKRKLDNIAWDQSPYILQKAALNGKPQPA